MLFPKAAPILIRTAVLLFPNLIALDYQGPVEVLGFLDPNFPGAASLPVQPQANIELTYVAPSLAPVHPIAGPLVVPDMSYEGALASGVQFDAILVPGGPGSRPNNVPAIVKDFIRAQAPGIQANPNGYFLSTCTGAWILADCGILNGKNATTNKNAFRTIVNSTDPSINWIAKARWVSTDNGKIWTSSGVSAGQDMGVAFFEYLNGKELATWVRGIVEVSERAQDDDEFADFYGLV